MNIVKSCVKRYSVPSRPTDINHFILYQFFNWLLTNPYYFQLTMIEVHSGLLMSRNGSQSPMINMEFHHNEENIHSLTKKDFAAKFAGFLVNYLNVPVER